MVPRGVINELPLFTTLVPLLVASLSRRWHPQLIATDVAPEFGYGLSVYDVGEDEVRRLSRKSERRGDFVRLNRDGTHDLDPIKDRLGTPVHLDVSQDDFEPWLVVDLHQFYFFQGLSTSGALLLLAQFGPGEIAVEEDEVLLGDVQRARD